MPEELKNLRAVFLNALEIRDPEQRSAYLAEACKGDDKLRAEVEALLKAHEQAGDFLESPPACREAPESAGADVTLDQPDKIDGPGTTIGRYQLLELIGEGGMGLVYLAEQKEPVKRRVAFKIIKPGMDSRQVIARFEAERQALAVLDHPNIAHVFDAGCTETGRPYFVMEYVRGMSITRYCDENKVAIEQRLRLFEQVCEAVHHAHQKGIIHRDLKPSNILVSVHGDRATPKIIDFGIAKAITSPLTDKTFVTYQGQLLGTPEYMSPEQVDLATQDIDTRSDIYSLGVVLYELLAGVLPFESEFFEKAGLAEIQQTIREQEPASPSIRLTNLGEKAKPIAASRSTQVVPLARRLHRELEWIPLKAMRKDRCRRYRSASEMADDIRNYLTGLPLIAGPETTIYRVQKFVHKHAGSVATVALVGAAIVIGLVVSTAMYFRAESMRVQAEQAREQEASARMEADAAREKETVARMRAEQAEEAAKQKGEELRRSFYVNSIQLADLKYKEGNMSRVRELLNACPNDLRGWEWNRLNYTSDQSLTTLRGHKGWVGCAAISPDGNRIASGGQADHTIRIWDVLTGRELITIPEAHVDIIRSLSFSRDGKRLVSGSDDKNVKVWDVETGAAVKTLRADGHVRSISISPDGRRIFSAGEGMTIRVWDAETGERLRTLTGHTGEISSLALGPDGRQIASGSWDGTIKVWDVESGTEAMTLRGDYGQLHHVAFSPDGRRIVSAGQEDNTIKIWDIVTGKELITIPEAHDGLGFIYSVAFSPDNKRICSGSWDQTIKVWDAATGKNVLTLHGHEGWVLSVAFGPDGRQIVSAGGADGTVKVWDVTVDHEVTKLVGHRGTVTSVAFSPDGDRIVSASANGMVKLWDTRNCCELMTLRDRQEEVYIYYVAFSPDGRYVASGGCARAFTIWDVATGAERMTFRGHEGSVDAVAFSPDGRHIASASADRTLKIWDVSNGKELMTLKGPESGLICAAFSPDGKLIASGSRDPNIKVWEWQTGREYLTLRGHDRGTILSVAFSPDGKRIVSASQEDHTVKVWDAMTGAELVTLKHADVVISAAFSPDGKRVISGCRDKAARVWDATTGAELLTLRAESGVTLVGFSPDGKTIAAGTFDGRVVLWESAIPSTLRERQNGEAARKVVEELHQKHGFYYKVIERLQGDTTLNEPIRKLALQIANSRKGEDAEKLVDELYKKRGSYRAVIDELQGDKTLDEATRTSALQIANSRKGQDAEKVMKGIWEEVRKLFGSPGGDPNAYRASLEKIEKANRMEPNNSGVLVAMGMMQSLTGQYEDAFKTQTKVHSLMPEMPPIVAALPEMQYHVGKKYQDAVKTLTEVLEISRRVVGEQDWSIPYLLNELACMQAGCPAAEVRDGAEAVKNATRACELTGWKEAMYVDTLAAAYSEVGEFDSAVKWQKEAIRLLTSKDPAEWPAEFEARLKLYESGKPYRESP
jgi:WD40 repeat protein/tRNA A-37 threonylcarbamoyl transferase component Bud32